MKNAKGEQAGIHGQSGVNRRSVDMQRILVGGSISFEMVAYQVGARNERCNTHCVRSSACGYAWGPIPEA